MFSFSEVKGAGHSIVGVNLRYIWAWLETVHSDIDPGEISEEPIKGEEGCGDASDGASTVSFSSVTVSEKELETQAIMAQMPAAAEPLELPNCTDIKIANEGFIFSKDNFVFVHPKCFVGRMGSRDVYIQKFPLAINATADPAQSKAQRNLTALKALDNHPNISTMLQDIIVYSGLHRGHYFIHKKTTMTIEDYVKGSGVTPDKFQKAIKEIIDVLNYIHFNNMGNLHLL